MAVRLTEDGPILSPASRLMDAAIELAIQERSPYPERAWFVDYDEPTVVESIVTAFDEDYAVVLVWPDGSSRVLQPGAQIPAPVPAASAARSESGSGIDLPAA